MIKERSFIEKTVTASTQKTLVGFTEVRLDLVERCDEKRNRFMLEIYAAVRAAVGPKFPVIIRLSADEMVEGGHDIKDAINTFYGRGEIPIGVRRAGVKSVHGADGPDAADAGEARIVARAAEDARQDARRFAQ